MNPSRPADKEHNDDTVIVKARPWILLCAVAAFMLCSLFPPWLSTLNTSGIHSERDAGYHFIFTPPAPAYDSRYYGVRLDCARLMIEWLSIAAASGVTWLVMSLYQSQRNRLREIALTGHSNLN